MEVVRTVISVFLLLFVGYGAKKIRVLSAEDSHLLSTVVLYFTLPAFVFDAIYSFRDALPFSIVKVPVIGFLCIVIVLFIAYLLGRVLKMERHNLGGFLLASGFGNTGFLGYPVVQAAFGGGSALVAAALYDEVAMAMPLYTVGLLIAASFAGDKVDGKQLKRALKIPALWAIPLAIILRPVPLPEPLLNTIRYLAEGTIPIAMISLGLSLSASSLKGMAVPVLTACLLKLAILPVITYFVAKASGITGVMHQVTVLESGMPTAVMAGVVASRFGASGRFVAGVIFVSTLLSIVTIPMLLFILGR